MIADGEALAVVLDGRLLQGFEVLLDVGALEGMACGIEPAAQIFSPDRHKQAVKIMSPYGLISLTESRSCVEAGLDVPEGMFHLPEFLVLEGHPLGRKVYVGLDHPFAIEVATLAPMVIFSDIDAGMTVVRA